MERKVIPFYFCKSRIPLVVFSLGDDKPFFVGVIDTGSEVTMFDYKMKDQGLTVLDTQEETSFVGVNGESGSKSLTKFRDFIRFTTKEHVPVSVPVSGILYDMTGLTEVFTRKLGKDITISAIFGADFLKEYNAKIDFRNKTMTISN